MGRSGPAAWPAAVGLAGVVSGNGQFGNVSLKLTEFPDPNGTCVYFRMPDLSVAMPDELLDGRSLSTEK